MKTKDGSKWVELMLPPQSLVGSISVETSPDMTPGENHVAVLDVNMLNCLQGKEPRKIHNSGL